MACHINCSDETREYFLTTLDRAQAFELCCSPGEDYKDFIELNKMLREAFMYVDGTNDQESTMKLNAINKWLDTKINDYQHLVKSSFNDFILRRRQKADINKRAFESIEHSINILNNVYFAMKCNSDISVPEMSQKSQFTENGKLMKEKVCSICENKFTANRQDAKYCSVKCRKAGSRQKVC